MQPGRKITVLYFAAVRELAGVSEETLELSAEVRTVEDLRRLLDQRHPEFVGRLLRVRFCINEQFVQLDAQLSNGDVVGLIPPVAGG